LHTPPVVSPWNTAWGAEADLAAVGNDFVTNLVTVTIAPMPTLAIQVARDLKVKWAPSAASVTAYGLGIISLLISRGCVDSTAM
jgi:hypothetical protein